MSSAYEKYRAARASKYARLSGDHYYCHYSRAAGVHFLIGLLGEEYRNYRLNDTARELYDLARTYNFQDLDTETVMYALNRNRREVSRT